MALSDEMGTMNIRSRYYDKVLKGFADRAYKFKQALTISPTTAWKNFFYREDTSVLAGLTGNATSGLPRGADFPQAVITWQQVQSVITKYGLEQNLHWEDILSNDIDVQERALFKLAEGVTKSVDDNIWDTLTESRTVVNIQSVSTNTALTGGGWNQSSAAIVDNLMNAKQLIAEQNYDVGNLMLFVSPKDHRNIIKYLTDKGSQFPQVSETAMSNGQVGSLLGIKIIVSNSVTSSYALVVVPKRVGTWKELVPLQTEVKDDPFKSRTVRAVEMGVTQLTDPKAAVLIIGTNITQ